MTEKAEFTPIKLDEDTTVSPQEERKARRRRKICLAVSIVVVIVLIIAAFVVGYFVRRAVKPGCEERTPDEHANGDKDPELQHREAIQGVSSERIEESLE